MRVLNKDFGYTKIQLANKLRTMTATVETMQRDMSQANVENKELRKDLSQLASILSELVNQGAIRLDNSSTENLCVILNRIVK